MIAQATKKRWGVNEIFEYAADLEEKDRARRGLERRTRLARLEKFKPMADFDWNWPTAIDRPLVDSLLSLDFLEAARNVVLVAPGGLGKTMIAKNIAHRAVLAGRSVLFLSAAQMLLDLGGQESTRALERRLHYYAKVGLLVVDELGFLAFDNRNADLIFQVVSRRYEKKRAASSAPRWSRPRGQRILLHCHQGRPITGRVVLLRATSAPAPRWTRRDVSQQYLPGRADIGSLERTRPVHSLDESVVARQYNHVTGEVLQELNVLRVVRRRRRACRTVDHLREASPERV